MYPVAVLVAVFMIVSGQGGARAASQAGGLPAVSDRVSALEGIARTLQAAVTALQTQVTTLQTANANLQSSLNNLQTALNTETAARTAGDTTLQAAVTQETQSRVAGDNNLSNQIHATNDLIGSLGTFYIGENTPGGLVMGAQATVATLGPLPAGNYLVIGTTQVRNTIHDVEWGCHVAGPAGEFLGGGITFTEANINPLAPKPLSQWLELPAYSLRAR